MAERGRWQHGEGQHEGCQAPDASRLPTPDLTPLGAVPLSSEREAGAKAQSWGAVVGGELEGPRSTHHGDPEEP